MSAFSTKTTLIAIHLCKAAVRCAVQRACGAHLLKINKFLTRAIDMQPLPLQRDGAGKRAQGQSAPNAPQCCKVLPRRRRPRQLQHQRANACGLDSTAWSAVPVQACCERGTAEHGGQVVRRGRRVQGLERAAEKLRPFPDFRCRERTAAGVRRQAAAFAPKVAMHSRLFAPANTL